MRHHYPSHGTVNLVLHCFSYLYRLGPCKKYMPCPSYALEVALTSAQITRDSVMPPTHAPQLPNPSGQLRGKTRALIYNQTNKMETFPERCPCSPLGMVGREHLGEHVRASGHVYSSSWGAVTRLYLCTFLYACHTRIHLK